MTKFGQNMKLLNKTKPSAGITHSFILGLFAIVFIFIFLATSFVVANGQTMGPNDRHVVNLYADGQVTSIPTRATTVKDFLDKAGIQLHEADLVEPGLYTPITQDDFNVQVYRARPVSVVDGTTVKRVLTPQTSAELVVEQAGFTVYPEDDLTFTTSTDYVKDMILGERLIIDRATPVNFSLYGSKVAVYRTQAKTVGGFLAEQNIVPEAGATVTPVESTPINPNMSIFVTKFGKQVVTTEEEVMFDIESTPDPTQTAGKITIIRPGVKGKKQVIYEVVMQEGQEVSRNSIQEVITELPQKQLQVIGTKTAGILTRSKGVNQFTDSHGVQHRETYYDLPMGVVINSCGPGGSYTVRDDGVKVDKDGYVLVAASLINYPRCSVVETSVGQGKVYDTGGFVSIYPYGFDIATDWSNNNGI